MKISTVLDQIDDGFIALPEFQRGYVWNRDQVRNRVNSGGTKLSKGDLALAKICAEWPAARDAMKTELRKWADEGYHFSLDWLLRSVNTVLTGEAKFSHLHDQGAPDIQDGLERASKQIDATLNMISGRLGLDHDRVFFGRFAIPVIVRYMDRRDGQLGARERDKLLFWFAQAGMWGRFSASTETVIDQDLAMLEGPNGSLDALVKQLSPFTGRTARRTGSLHGLEPRRAVLSHPLHADPNGRSLRLEQWCAAQEEFARKHEPPGSAPHLSEVAALRSRAHASGRERPGELLFPDEELQFEHRQSPTRTLLSGSGGGTPRRTGFPMDPDGPCALEDGAVSGLPRSSQGPVGGRGQQTLRGTPAWRHAMADRSRALSSRSGANPDGRHYERNRGDRVGKA